MSETLPRLERTSSSRTPRLEYGAVPLDPYHASDPEGSDSYINGSNGRIREKLQFAMLNVTNRGLMDDAQHIERTFNLMEAALYNSQMSRVKHNPSSELDAIAGSQYDERVARAKEGLATPNELLELLETYPQLGSIELAKLSHPFDFAAPDAMDEDVYETMLSRGGELIMDSPRYKRKAVDADNPDVPIGIVLRKKGLIRYQTPEGNSIEITKRQGFVVWASETQPDADLARKIRNPERFLELTTKIEGYLEYLGSIPEPDWLQPLATSYYARIVENSTSANE